MLVLFVDECHLLWGNICGYVWGKTDSRIEVGIENEKQKPTYYGALDYPTGKVIVKAYEPGNTESTIAFVKELIKLNPQDANSAYLGWC